MSKHALMKFNGMKVALLPVNITLKKSLESVQNMRTISTKKIQLIFMQKSIAIIGKFSSIVLYNNMIPLESLSAIISLSENKTMKGDYQDKMQ